MAATTRRASALKVGDTFLLEGYPMTIHRIEKSVFTVTVQDRNGNEVNLHPNEKVTVK